MSKIINISGGQRKSRKHKQVVTIVSFVILAVLCYLSYNSSVDEETIKGIEIFQDEVSDRMEIILVILGSVSFVAFITGMFTISNNNN